jgi:hypothetical protein
VVAVSWARRRFSSACAAATSSDRPIHEAITPVNVNEREGSAAIACATGIDKVVSRISGIRRDLRRARLEADSLLVVIELLGNIGAF